MQKIVMLLVSHLNLQFVMAMWRTLIWASLTDHWGSNLPANLISKLFLPHLISRFKSPCQFDYKISSPPFDFKQHVSSWLELWMILVHQRQTKTRKFSKTWPFKSVTDEMFGRLPTERKGAKIKENKCANVWKLLREMGEKIRNENWEN